MMHLRWALSLLLFADWSCSASAQTRKRLDHIVVYKDGFYIKGRVSEKVGEVLYDSASGQSFPIFAGEFAIDDNVRSVYFSHGQIQKVIPQESNESKPVVRFKLISQPLRILDQFVFETFSPWNEKGERTIHVNNNKGRGGYIDMTQRVGLLTPHYIKAFTVSYAWDLVYSTQEFGPKLTRAILLQIFSEKKEYREMKGAQKYLELAKFMQEAGWFEDAEKELTDTMANFPNEQKIVEERLKNLKQVRANLLVESILQASNVGQHEIAQGRLATYDADESSKIVQDRLRLAAVDAKADYEKAKAKLAEARRLLKSLAALTKSSSAWPKACEFIAEELTYDTIGLRAGRLDTFLDFAQQFEMDQKASRKPNQSVEQVLALAVSGWLQGNQAAEPDTKAALKLLRARQFVLEYLQSDSSIKRASLLSEFKRSNDLPVDVIARVVRMIPPSHPYDAKNLGTEVMNLDITLPDSSGGAYLVQLPPDYNPMRSYPVLMVCHSGRDKPEEALKRFSDEAAKHGFILVAPLWAGAKSSKAKYQYSEREQTLVLDTLRDLRRRFQIDSDRVFLFGWEDGANLAYDVGLGHPDLFAGVVPMGGSLSAFTRRFYWPNAQYLPFYIIDGDRNGNGPKLNRDLMKDWMRDPYACTFVEYRGRGSEWYSAEVSNILSWMSRKKRHNPIKELGRANNGGSGLGEEFRSSRGIDNHFYWVSSDAIAERNMNDHRTKWDNLSYRPATFQANVKAGNLLIKKEAKTWYEVNLRATGMKQLSLWITPSLMELPNLVTVRVNNQEVWTKRLLEPNLDTMMEELYRTGDRQRLYVAKLDFRL